MKKVIIDTNVFLSFVSDRNPRQQALAAGLFERAASLKTTILCPFHVASEAVYVLTSVYGAEASTVNAMLGAFIATPGLDVLTDVSLAGVLKLWPSAIADYGDAVIAAQCRNVRGSAIATFDRSFRKQLTKLKIPLFEFS